MRSLIYECRFNLTVLPGTLDPGVDWLTVETVELVGVPHIVRKLLSNGIPEKYKHGPGSRIEAWVVVTTNPLRRWYVRRGRFSMLQEMS